MDPAEAARVRQLVMAALRATEPMAMEIIGGAISDVYDRLIVSTWTATLTLRPNMDEAMRVEAVTGYVALQALEAKRRALTWDPA